MKRFKRSENTLKIKYTTKRSLIDVGKNKKKFRRLLDLEYLKSIVTNYYSFESYHWRIPSKVCSSEALHKWLYCNTCRYTTVSVWAAFTPGAQMLHQNTEFYTKRTFFSRWKKFRKQITLSEMAPKIKEKVKNSPLFILFHWLFQILFKN